MSDQAFLIGPASQITKITGPVGTTPECPEAKFEIGNVVRVRRLKHLRDIPEIAAIVCVIPPNFSPDWAWADLKGVPRPLMCQVGMKSVSYLIAFEGVSTAVHIREKYLIETHFPSATIQFAKLPE